MISYSVELAPTQIINAIDGFEELQRQRADLMRDIATLGENTTRERFATETAPDGTKWKPSLRALMQGGKTLTLDGHLSGSLGSRSDDNAAEWGFNRIYARIHQEGGVISAKTSSGLRWRAPGGGFVTKQKVTIPARPSLGISDRDESEILDLIEARIPGGAQ